MDLGICKECYIHPYKMKELYIQYLLFLSLRLCLIFDDDYIAGNCFVIGDDYENGDFRSLT